MKAPTLAIVATSLTTLFATASAQNSLTPISVCDVLGNPSKYDGKNIAVLGRSESDESGLVCCFVEEDHCPRQGESVDSGWPNRIWVNCCNGTYVEGRSASVIEPISLIAELDRLRKTTTLQVRRKVDFKVEGDVGHAIGWRNVKDAWEIAHGRVEISNDLKPPKTEGLAARQAHRFGDPPDAAVQIIVEDIPHYLTDEAAELFLCSDLGHTTSTRPCAWNIKAPPGTSFSVGFTPGLDDNMVYMPNDGFGIRLDSYSVIWVDASNEEREQSPHSTAASARLGTLPALRQSWRTTEHRIEILHESVVAKWFDRGMPIIYTVQLDTTPEHRDEAVKAFDAVLNSFCKNPGRP